jgi:hypothetical protein
MGRWLAAMVALGCGALIGCLSTKTQHTTARLHGPPPAAVVGEDVVYLDVFVIERPLGDAFLNRELWSEADEQAVHADGEPGVSLERKMALEKNGFRAGLLGGALPPTKLQDLLASQRSCQGNRIQRHAGHETKIALGSVWPHCCCRLAREEQTTAVDFEKGQCLLQVTPELADEGRVRLRFTPHIKHGDVRMEFVPVRGDDGLMRWGMQERQPEEAYSWLDWTLSVAPNEYVVIGAQLGSGDTLGEQFFLSGEDNPGVQRLLVLRATHVPTPAEPIEANLSRTAPLALQASLSAAVNKE